MVDVSAKAVTAREARAECLVRFPAAVAKQLRAGELRGEREAAKGRHVEMFLIGG